jgi:hypothetical protein
MRRDVALAAFGGTRSYSGVSLALMGIRLDGTSGRQVETGINGEFTHVMLTGNDNNHIRPAVAAGKDGQLLVVWEADRGLDEHRIEARFVQAK